MSTIQHVLCAVDFSPASLRALRYATAVAGRTGASLLALNVFHAPRVLRAALPQYAGAMLDRGAYADLLAQLDQAVGPARDRGVTAGVRVREGDIVDEIFDIARSARADLIVMGTHGRGAVSRLVLGSIAEKVLRGASCPVLTVPPAAGDPAPETDARFARVLCCTDFTADADAAFRFALTLVPEADADVRLMHVVEWAIDDTQLASGAAAARALREREEAEAGRRLDAAIADVDAGRRGVTGAVVVSEKPYDEILRYADQARVDLIVMGVGRRGLADRLVGSTTDRVVRAAGCPVLTFRG